VNVYVNWRQWARPRKAVNWIDMAVQIPLAVRAATRIITLSEASKELICRMLHVEQQRIAVVAGAPDPFFDESPSKAEAAEATALTGGRPYVLFVGIISPQKNLETLVRAFAKSALGGEDVALVLAGSDREGEGTALKRLAAATGAGGQLVLTGFVSKPVLRALYHRAEAVVMPSHGEGFGLPLVEAMASGAPVLAANRQSLPEVAGDAGVLFEPDDVDDLARLLRRVHQDPAFRRDLVERGHKRRHVYSWKAAAEATARIYDEVASIRR